MLRKAKKLLVALPLMVATMLITGQAFASEEGFAKVRANGSLATFGGTDTTATTSTRNFQGNYTVQFFGSFPSGTMVDNVVVNTTAESAVYGVSNAVVTSADPTQITVTVWTWTSNVLSPVDNTFFITVFVGN